MLTTAYGRLTCKNCTYGMRAAVPIRMFGSPLANVARAPLLAQIATDSKNGFGS